MARAIRGMVAALVAVSAACALAPPACAATRVQLAPRFVPGETLTYQLDLRSTIRSRARGPIRNPEAPTRLDLSISAIVRLDVLGVEPAGSPGAAESARLRATYQTVDATAHSDAYDPSTRGLLEQYGRLKGRSIEFTLEGDGSIRQVRGLEEILPDERARSGMEQALSKFVLAGSLPRRGIATGEKWSSERPVTAIPLLGLAWRLESRYLRNEPCQPKALAGRARGLLPEAARTCAVIETQSETVRRAAPRDRTPPELRARGLKTSGRWSGAGESLSYVSLETGWVVSVTATGMESMDLVIATADGSSRVEYAGELETQSQFSLLSEEMPGPGKH
jgi:hypothetical protein